MVQFEQIARGLEFELAAGLVEQHAVEVLDGRRSEVEQFDCRLHRFRHRREENQAQSLSFRQGTEF